MKFHHAALATGVSTLLLTLAPASSPPNSAAPQQPLPALITELANPHFQARESAMNALWATGESALPSLLTAAQSADPEQAHRARELIRKIEFFITPKTDPAVSDIVETFATSTSERKSEMLRQLAKLRAWRQILKLYTTEKNPDHQHRLESAVGAIENIAVTAAREALNEGKPHEAKKFLEMAPATTKGLIALAEFHRAQGTLPAELARAKSHASPESTAWRLALHRSAGDIPAAQAAATTIGEAKLSAALAALTGDPIPWLTHSKNQTKENDDEPLPRLYSQLAINHWLGKPIRPSDLEPFTQHHNSENSSDRRAAINYLLLLGQHHLMEKALTQHSPIDAFTYFEGFERIPEALAALGLDASHPDYPAWVRENLKIITSINNNDDGEKQHLATQKLILLAQFFEGRGLNTLADTAFIPPLLTLAAEDKPAFIDLIKNLSTQVTPQHTTQLIGRIATAWAGDKNEAWEDIILAVWGEDNQALDLWSWLEDLSPEASLSSRFEGFRALAGLGKDPELRYPEWLKLAWDHIDSLPPEKRPAAIGKLAHLTSSNPDVSNHLKISTALKNDQWGNLDARLLDLSASGRWTTAADIFLKLIETNQPNIQLSWHAYAASALRRAGRIAEANTQDELIEKLSLGNDLLQIANGYTYGMDHSRAAAWRARAATLSDPDSADFATAMDLHATASIENNDWKTAASVLEVTAQIIAKDDISSDKSLQRLRTRIRTDMCRALSQLRQNRTASITLLEKCHRTYPADASLADEFFPALRKAGLTKEHDAWFAISWTQMLAVITAYPLSDNTHNSAAWLAARAQKQLEEAETFEKKALILNPNQSAYLDTMAEIHFAKGNRTKAIEFSDRAINFLPADPMIRLQNQRFRSKL